MAVYFDHRLETAPGTINTDLSWFSGAPLLAVTSYGEENGGFVTLYNEGEKILNTHLEQNCHATSVAWHPSKKIVAVGWENGELLVWNEQDHNLFEGVHMHKAPITLLQWSSNGTRLFTGDKQGILIVWKSDSKGRLQQNPVCQHHIQEPLTDIVLKPAPPPDPATDISELARAAVSGDESALDMFNWKRGKNNKMMTTQFGPSEALSFFVGGASGGVYFVNESGQCIQSFSVDGPVRKLMYYEEKNILVTITDNLLLSQHSVMSEGDTKELLKVKLSGRTEQPDFIWASKGLLVTATGEMVIRLWDLDLDDNYVLSLDGHSSYDQNETIICLGFNAEKGIIAGGTNMGNIAMWKYSPMIGYRKVDGDEKWKLQAPATVEGPVRQIKWGGNKALMAVTTIANVFILSEQVMTSSYMDQTAVVQYGPSSLSIEMFATGNHHDLKTDIQVKGICTTKDALAVWNGKRVIIYEYSSDKLVLRGAGSFTTDSMMICLYEQNVYSIEQNKVQVRTFQGTVKQHLVFTDLEGDPVSINVCGNYLVIATEHGIIKVYDLVRREAKMHCNPKDLADFVHDFGGVISVRCNAAGNRVSILTKKSNGEPDNKLYLWDVENDSVQYFNFETGRGEQDDYPPPDGKTEESDADTNDAERGKNQAAKDIAGRRPLSHTWDPSEPKLLVCEAKILPLRETKELKRKPSLSKPVEEEPVETMIVSLFCTPENGVLIQDSFAIPEQYNSLLGVEVPYHYFVKKPENLTADDGTTLQADQTSSLDAGQPVYPTLVARRVMRDFVGLEGSDKVTRDAMMNFSYYLTVGNMDEAFKAIKLIKSESVWENMAKMCVKSRRLDVASVCLGNMGHARGAKALREAVREPELDAKVAVLAIQLELFEDAERLLRNCKRYDLLNQFYQDRGQWNKALETAEMYDRIHLRTTYYNYAKHLEESGDPGAAIPHYEKSETHRFEVPRMLLDDAGQLEQYVQKSKDKSLRKWWAQYLESNGDMETALQYYEEAQDYMSLVRVYCFCNNMEKAAEVCNETGDRAACYYLARQYENQNQIKEAIHFFTRAQAFGGAIRLCKEHDYEDQLVNLALMGRPEDMMEAARYYEEHPRYHDKAVMLYHKAGNFSKALDLAFKTKQFGALQLISGDLDERADPELLQQCADFFLENEQYDKAVDLLAIGKKYWEALKICMDKHVDITEDLAEKLTPPKVEGENDMERLKILEAIGEVCMHQGQYHQATKKYTQAGNKMKAMKALLKSGDTEKIIFFAGVSRQKEIYVMAANYLQSLDWRKDPEIMKTIIGFYNKGRALDSLAAFYDACAQVEIDEYQNYEKALGALGEAYKCLSRAKMEDSVLQEEKLAQLNHKMALVKKFITARRVYNENSEEAIKQCQVLLEEPNVDTAVRIGDLFGFIIEHYTRKERWKAAYSALEEMRGRIRGANITYFVNIKLIEAIHTALNIPLSRTITASTMNGFHTKNTANEEEEEEEGEFVEEDVIDEMYNTGGNV